MRIILATIAIVSCAWPAMASRVHYRNVPLSELATSAELILVVRGTKPLQVQKQIPLGKRRGKQLPAFVKISYQLEVVEVLVNRTGRSYRQGKKLRVAVANWRRSLRRHRDYYKRGMRRSYIAHRYRGGISALTLADKNKQAIVFVQRDGRELRMVVSGALVEVGKRDEVLRLSKKSGRLLPK